jgi:hypothetical protein
MHRQNSGQLCSPMRPEQGQLPLQQMYLQRGQGGGARGAGGPRAVAGAEGRGGAGAGAGAGPPRPPTPAGCRSPCSAPGHVVVQRLLAEAVGGALGAPHGVAADCGRGCGGAGVQRPPGVWRPGQRSAGSSGARAAAHAASAGPCAGGAGRPARAIRTRPGLTAGARADGLQEGDLPEVLVPLAQPHDLVLALRHLCSAGDAGLALRPVKSGRTSVLARVGSTSRRPQGRGRRQTRESGGACVRADVRGERVRQRQRVQGATRGCTQSRRSSQTHTPCALEASVRAPASRRDSAGAFWL